MYGEDKDAFNAAIKERLLVIMMQYESLLEYWIITGENPINEPG